MNSGSNCARFARVVAKTVPLLLLLLMTMTTMMMFSLLLTFLTTRNKNARRFHHLNTFRFFLQLWLSSPHQEKFWQNRPQKKFSSCFLTPLSSYNKQKTKNQIMGLTSRREKIVLFGDSLTQRAIEQGGWGESLVRRARVYIHFLFLFVYYYALCVLFLCVSVLVFFIAACSPARAP